MLHYQSATPKRTKVWSNSHMICKLDLGAITREMIAACTVKSTDTYVDSSGKKRYKGNANLKRTQCLNSVWENF